MAVEVAARFRRGEGDLRPPVEMACKRAEGFGQRFDGRRVEFDAFDGPWRAGQYGVIQLGWQTSLLHLITTGELG